uniref:glycosyltransferase n=1 Tax=Ruminococcus sp. TaxID=41978 RepID=UPI0025D7E6A9
ADAICAVSQTYVDRALKVNNRCRKGVSVFLGTDLNIFDENAVNNKVERDDDRLRLAYCGTLGSSYDLTCVIDALDIIKKKGLQLPKFIVMGDGPDKERFEKYSKEKDVDAEFLGRMPYDKMCGMLKSCDMTVNPITHGAAQSIINKHADYVASGLPVLNTQECREYRKLVKEYKMGFNCKNGDAEDLADKLERLIKEPKLRKIMGNNARKCAEELFNRKNSYLRITDLIEKE